jgi:O-antigen/teichoic acid export membrane protein
MFTLLREKRLFGDAWWALFGQFGSALALLAGTRMLTEWVTPDMYGKVALLNGFVALGVSLFSYPFIGAGMRIVSECKNALERADLYTVVASLTVCSTAMAITFLMLGGAAYGYFTDSDIRLFALASLLLAVTVRRELGIQLLIGERKQRGASFWQTSDSILRPVLALVLVWYFGGKAEWVLSGYILASLFANTLWGFVQRLQTAKPEPQTQTGKGRDFRSEVWLYALPLIPMEVIFWLNGLGDRYVIGYFMTAADVGLYAATYTIINEAFNRSAMVLLRTFQPAYFQTVAKNQSREGFVLLWLWIGGIVALGVGGVAVLLMTKDWLADLLLAKAYHSAVMLMPAIAIGSALHALGTVVAQPLLANKRPQAVLKGRICGAVIAAISIPLLVKYDGLAGAAIANPLYFGVEALVLALLAKPWRAISPKANQGEDSRCDVRRRRINLTKVLIKN